MRWEGLEFPKALRQMPSAALPEFCAALRQHMAKACTGQAALEQALSAVELTLALHRVFRTPYEVLLFEKEALALAHRLLTGQRQGFPSEASRLPHPLDTFDKSHGPLALAHAWALLQSRRLSKHAGKVVVVLEEARPVQKESFGVLSQREAADAPWVLLLARAGGVSAEGFLPHAALAEFFGSLGFGGLWPTLEGASLEEMEVVFRQAKAAHKAVVLHIQLPEGVGGEKPSPP